jgi:hypothetical protein
VNRSLPCSVLTLFATQCSEGLTCERCIRLSPRLVDQPCIRENLWALAGFQSAQDHISYGLFQDVELDLTLPERLHLIRLSIMAKDWFWDIGEYWLANGSRRSTDVGRAGVIRQSLKDIQLTLEAASHSKLSWPNLFLVKGSRMTGVLSHYLEAAVYIQVRTHLLLSEL